MRRHYAYIFLCVLLLGCSNLTPDAEGIRSTVADKPAVMITVTPVAESVDTSVSGVVNPSPGPNPIITATVVVPRTIITIVGPVATPVPFASRPIVYSSLPESLVAEPLFSDQVLRDFRKQALEQINDLRVDNGLYPLKLGNNKAAQLHAEDSLDKLYLSQWTSQGLTSDMLYTQLGGTGYVSWRGLWSGYLTGEKIAECQSPRVICQRIDVEKEINEYYERGIPGVDQSGFADDLLDGLAFLVGLLGERGAFVVADLGGEGGDGHQ